MRYIKNVVLFLSAILVIIMKIPSWVVGFIYGIFIEVGFIYGYNHGARFGMWLFGRNNENIDSYISELKKKIDKQKSKKQGE